MHASNGLFCSLLSPGGRGISLSRALSSVFNSSRLPHRMKSFSSIFFKNWGSLLRLQTDQRSIVRHIKTTHSFAFMSRRYCPTSFPTTTRSFSETVLGGTLASSRSRANPHSQRPLGCPLSESRFLCRLFQAGSLVLCANSSSSGGKKSTTRTRVRWRALRNGNLKSLYFGVWAVR
jgi:hypothetical protein